MFRVTLPRLTGGSTNVAARIQGLAAPDTVVISEITAKLVQGYFETERLGKQTLRGVPNPMAVYRVLRESEAQSRLDIASVLTPLVGREQEVHLLLDRWAQAKAGQGQVVVLSGEAGIGKSRLVQVLKEQVNEESSTRIECRSSPYHQNTALHPVTEFIQRALQWQPDDGAEEKLRKPLLAAGWPARDRVLGECGGNWALHQRAGGSHDAARHAGAYPTRTDVADYPRGTADDDQGLCGPRGRTRLHTRACVVSRQVGQTPQLFPALWGLWMFYLVRATLATARELGEQLLHLAEQAHDPTLLLQAHMALGITLFHLGKFMLARLHLEQGLALYDPQQHHALAFLSGQDGEARRSA